MKLPSKPRRAASSASAFITCSCCVLCFYFWQTTAFHLKKWLQDALYFTNFSEVEKPFSWIGKFGWQFCFCCHRVRPIIVADPREEVSKLWWCANSYWPLSWSGALKTLPHRWKHLLQRGNEAVFVLSLAWKSSAWSNNDVVLGDNGSGPPAKGRTFHHWWLLCKQFLSRPQRLWLPGLICSQCQKGAFRLLSARGW